MANATVKDVMRLPAEALEPSTLANMEGVPYILSIEKAAAWLDSREATIAFVFDTAGQAVGFIDRGVLPILPSGAMVPLLNQIPEICCRHNSEHGNKKQCYPYNHGIPNQNNSYYCPGCKHYSCDYVP